MEEISAICWRKTVNAMNGRALNDEIVQER